MSLYDEFPDGVKAYEGYSVKASVYFPNGRVMCKYCKFCRYDRNRGGYMCYITEDILYATDKGVGIGCPLERIKE